MIYFLITFKRFLLLVLLLFNLSSVFTQPMPYANDSYRVSYSDLGIIDLGSNTFSFNADNYLNTVYPLTPHSYPGAPPPEYRLLWHFGDGQMSTDPYPVHTYPESGDYEVTLFATPWKSPDDEPPSLHYKLIIGSDAPCTGPTNTVICESGVATQCYHTTLDIQPIKLEINRSPRVNRESTVIITFKNSGPNVENIFLDFLYDDNEFQYLELFGSKGEYVESSITDSSAPLKFNRKLVISSGTPMCIGEERKIFLQFRTKVAAGGMGSSVLPDLHFRVTPSGGTTGDELRLLASGPWDPNTKVAFRDTLDSPTYTGPLKMKYRIDFENVGNDYVSNITIKDVVSSFLHFDSFTYLGDKYDHDTSNIEFDYNTSTREITIMLYDYNLPGASCDGATPPCYNDLYIERSKSYVEVEFNLNIPMYEELLEINCQDMGNWDFGEYAQIIFDSNPPIRTNVALTDVICSQEETQSVEILELSPVPVSDILNVSFLSEIAGELEFSIQSQATGDVESFGTSYDGSIGEHRVSLNIAEYDSGSYVFFISENNIILDSAMFIKL